MEFLFLEGINLKFGIDYKMGEIGIFAFWSDFYMFFGLDDTHSLTHLYNFFLKCPM